MFVCVIQTCIYSLRHVYLHCVFFCIVYIHCVYIYMFLIGYYITYLLCKVENIQEPFLTFFRTASRYDLLSFVCDSLTTISTHGILSRDF